MIAIINYGVGNLFSLQSSIKKIGEKSIVTADTDTILNADKIILPGVGAFGDAADKLQKSGLGDAVKQAVKQGKQLLGICLGMQLLFTKSYEYGEHTGLDIIKGEVVPFKNEVKPLKVPHMGWNCLNFKKSSPLFKYCNDGDFVYFVHSYMAVCDKKYISATSDYGIEICAAVESGNVYGTQFHPEKSGETGLKILKAFAQLKERQ